MKKRRKAKNRRWPAAAAVVALVILSQGISLTVDRQLEKWQMEEIRQMEEIQHTEDAAYTETVAVQVPAVSAGAAILVDGADGAVLYEYNADKKMYPASTTKIMTALVVLELCEELNLGLDSQLIIPDEAEGVEGSSLYLKAGERLTLEELMYGLMLQSGNDGAVALASCMGGGGETGVELFVEQMNQKAAELGCTGTQFVNPNGLPDENHYTTARDLAVIAQEAMKHEEFRQIVSAKEWSDAAAGEGAASQTPRTFVNKNKTVFQYDGGDGIKIGYTKASGRTLVASASRSGRTVIAVVLNDGNWFQDAYALMDYGFRVLETAGRESAADGSSAAEEEAES